MYFRAVSRFKRTIGPVGGKQAMPETARKMPLEIRDANLILLLDPAKNATATSEMTHISDIVAEVNSAENGIPAYGSLPMIVLSAIHCSSFSHFNHAQNSAG